MAEDVMGKFYDESREQAAKHGNRLIMDLTDAEFRKAAKHTWLNAFSCINPSDEFLIEVGRGVVNALNASDLVDGLTGSPSMKHVILHFNKS